MFKPTVMLNLLDAQDVARSLLSKATFPNMKNPVAWDLLLVENTHRKNIKMEQLSSVKC